MKRLLVLVLAAAIAVPAYAHHSFSAYYFENESMTIEGEVIEFEFKSPHAWLHVMVKDANGQMQKFSAEWANPNNLTRQRINKDTLRPGDLVIVTGSPGRNAADHKLHLKGIERPMDGWKWDTGRRRR